MEVVAEFQCHKINKSSNQLDRWTHLRRNKMLKLELALKGQCPTEVQLTPTILFTLKLRIRLEWWEAWLAIKQELIQCQQWVQTHITPKIRSNSNKRVKSLTPWWKYKVLFLDQTLVKQDQIRPYQLRKNNRFKIQRVEWSIRKVTTYNKTNKWVGKHSNTSNNNRASRQPNHK